MTAEVWLTMPLPVQIFIPFMVGFMTGFLPHFMMWLHRMHLKYDPK